jgi:hypothetical protein
MAIIQDWKIRSTHARCEVSGEPFLDGDQFYTCIFDEPASEGFARRDYSAAAWKKARKKLEPAPFSFWKSTYKAPVRAAEDHRTSDTSVEGMLRRFIDEDDPRTENARYILALMLERKKTLIPTDAKETETRTLLFYEHADNGDVFIVADPGLRLDEIESVQREVVDLLAEEDRRAAGELEPVEEAAEEQAEKNEDETKDDGEKSTESEEEPVALSCHEAPERVGFEAGVDTGEKLTDEVDDHLERTDRGEEPSAPDDQPQSE